MAITTSGSREPKTSTEDRDDMPPRDRDQHAVSAARAHDKADEAEAGATREVGDARDRPVTGRDHLQGSPDSAAGNVSGTVPGSGGRDDEERRRSIAEHAYYKAERRGFAPGGEEADWLEAEREIKASAENTSGG